MTEEEIKSAGEWIMNSEDTNQYCERSFTVAALQLLEENKIDEAIKALRQAIPLSVYLNLSNHQIL